MVEYHDDPKKPFSVPTVQHCFWNCSICQNCLHCFFTKVTALRLQISDLVALEWGPRICISNKFPEIYWHCQSQSHTLRATSVEFAGMNRSCQIPTMLSDAEERVLVLQKSLWTLGGQAKLPWISDSWADGTVGNKWAKEEWDWEVAFQVKASRREHGACSEQFICSTKI